MNREELRQIAWHRLLPDEALDKLEARADGLSPEEVRQRWEWAGPNKLAARKKRSALVRFFALFHNVLIYILLAAALITALLGHWLDTGVIAGVVLVNTIIGFFQEGKAERALEAIARMISHECTVLRAGGKKLRPAEEVVPGDVILLHAGDKVPADLRLLEANALAIDESLLTGESSPVRKEVEPVAGDAVLGDRFCMAFSGTLVTAGSGRGVVIATGNDTQIGRISELVDQTPQIDTPLIRQIAAFGRALALVIVGVAVFTFFVGVVVWSGSWVDMFLASVALAVAAIPEGLPAIMTITLALGVQRMAARNAIIRRLPAVDTLGAITTICSDKTGTLTRNEMMVKLLRTGGDRFMIDGQGYEPAGAIRRAGEKQAFDCASHPALLECARTGLLCNDAEVLNVNDGGGWRCEGDPMEGALVVFAGKAGMDAQAERRAWPRLDVLPFDSKHRYMATLHRDPGGKRVVFIKGAPEVVLGMCDREATRDGIRPINQADWDGHYEALASAGTRVLALARAEAPDGVDKLRKEDWVGHAVLMGVNGIYDPPRDSAIAAVKECRNAGIRVKMLTGDHALTATAIGRMMGIGDGATALTGKEIEACDDEALALAVVRTDIFARVSPEHKLRLVQALQSRGEVVAMTGDGVNDAPALKCANVGIAMGIKGTEVSKESSEMVLADDHFASIVHAIEEGRTVYANLRKAILFLLPTNGGQALTIIAAIMAGLTLPITPVQILWVNMITAVTLAVALAFEPPEKGIMKLPPRSPDQPLLTGLFIWRIGFVSITRCLGTFGLFLWARQLPGMDEAYARTVAVNTLVLFEVFYLMNVRSIKASGLTLATWTGSRIAVAAMVTVVAGQFLFTYWSPLQALFDTQPLPARDWFIIVAITLASYFLIEAEKAGVRVYERRRGEKRIAANTPDE